MAKTTPTAEKATVSTIMDLWNLSGDDKKKADREDNLGLLKANANFYLIKTKQRAAQASKTLKDAMANAETSNNFEAIAEASLESKAAQVELEEAVDTFVSMFGENPSK